MSKSLASSKRRMAFVLAVLVSVAGCGKKLPAFPKTYPVTGKVTSPSGKSVAGMVIIFKPAEGDEVGSTVKPDGTYNARMFPNTDGLTPGDYQVYAKEHGAEAGSLPDKYKKPETSGLKITVTSGDNTFDITLQ
jgi:hypothetical protein